jgi:Tol biopolymer transport system component
MSRLFVIFVFLFSVTSFSQSNTYFLSNPTLTPDGQTVIFAYEGDLWKANASDGNATRLTAMQGYETSPVFLLTENGSHLPEDNMVTAIFI